MDMNESEEETGATTEDSVLEDAATTTAEPVTEDKAAVTEKPVAEEKATIPEDSATEAVADMTEISIIERVSITIDALDGLVAAVNILGTLGVVAFFVYLCSCSKQRDEDVESFSIFLFSVWASFRHEVSRGAFDTNIGSQLPKFIVGLGDGGYVIKKSLKRAPSKGPRPKAGEGQKLLLPKRRREIVNEIKKFTEICAAEYGGEIVLQGTSARFCFFAGENEFKVGEERWKRLGDLIEQEAAAIFINKHPVDEVHLIEIVFSDEGRKAKSMVFPENPREAEEAEKWFRWRVVPLFALSIFIVHWALLGAVLAGAYFLYKSEPEKEEPVESDSKTEKPNGKRLDAAKLRQMANDQRKRQQGKETS